MADIPAWARDDAPTAAPAVPAWAQGDPLDDVAKDSMRREAQGYANKAEGDALPDWLLAMTPDAIKPAVREGMGSIVRNAKEIPGKIADGISSAAKAVVDDPTSLLTLPYRVGEGIGNAAKHPAETADKVLRYSAENPVEGVLNGLTLGTGGELTLGRGALKAGTKTAAGIDAAAVRPVNSLLSGVSGEAQRLAQSAGEQGGAAGRAFRTNMAEPDFAGMQAEGKAGVRGLKAERGSGYDQGMQAVQNSTARLRYQPIQQALHDARARFALGRNGFVKDEAAMATLDRMQQAIDEHRTAGLPSGLRAVARTPLEMDELKQRLNSAWRSLPDGSRSEAALNPIRDAISSQITSAVPEYADVMAGYGGASDAIDNAVSSLSLGKRATRGTAAGKLMSAMRDTGSATQITKGEALADVARHAPTLPYQIAGATMNPVLPRGIVARGGALMHGIEGMGAGAALAHFLHPGTLIPLLASSPRVIGNARYGIGAATRGARRAGATQKNLGLASEAARLSSIWNEDEQ